MHTFTKKVSILSAIAFLTACGGGGGSSDTVTNTVTPTIATTPIQTTVLAATYAGGTEQRNAYDYLNSQRQLCGFGLLQQDARIDTAAQAHSDYFITNNLTTTHYENKDLYPNGFTGVYPWDRAIAAGYPNGVSEVIAEPSATYGSTLGQAAVMDLFLSPYHGYGMLRSDRDIGIGYSKNSSRNPFVIDFGSTAQRTNQMMMSTQVATYPCNGTTGVLAQSYHDEAPAPISGRNLQTNPIGHPIYLKVVDGNTLVLTSYDLRKVGTNTSLAMQLLDKAHDSASIIADNSSAALIPLLPLEKNASYLFTATGTNNGSAISVSFTFGTGAF